MKDREREYEDVDTVPGRATMCNAKRCRKEGSRSLKDRNASSKHKKGKSLPRKKKRENPV